MVEPGCSPRWSGRGHAFVATDLLWLDDEPLDDVSLLERKRLLEAVLEPSYLVRISPYVKPSAELTLVTWRDQGFALLHYRAANSGYLAGRGEPGRPSRSAGRPRDPARAGARCPRADLPGGTVGPCQHRP